MRTEMDWRRLVDGQRAEIDRLEEELNFAKLAYAELEARCDELEAAIGERDRERERNMERIGWAGDRREG